MSLRKERASLRCLGACLFVLCCHLALVVLCCVCVYVVFVCVCVCLFVWVCGCGRGGEGEGGKGEGGGERVLQTSAGGKFNSIPLNLLSSNFIQQIVVYFEINGDLQGRKTSQTRELWDRDARYF